MAVSRVLARKQRVFGSVFQTDVSQPTPSLPSTQVGEAFGGPLAAHLNSRDEQHIVPPLEPPSDQVRWDRAWHAVTSRILLPSSVAAEDSFGTLIPESQDLDTTFTQSLALVLDPRTALPRASHTEDILQWHTQQVRQHFINHVLPLLAACASQGDNSQILLGTIQTLEAAHRQYLYGLSLLARGIQDERLANTALVQFRRDLHAIIGNSWTSGLTVALRGVVSGLLRIILGPDTRHAAGDMDPALDSRVTRARDELLGLLESLQEVGLAGEKFHVLFAELMDSCMVNYIRSTYAGHWLLPDKTASSAVLGSAHYLCDWIENQYGRLAVEVFGRLGGHVSWNDVERWRDIAVGRLATLRINELFDIVLDWPQSKGGLDDLRLTVITPQRRLQLTETFSAAMQRRLLHPGRSTLDILQTYISMIRTFHALDHSKVLLDRVVHALQLYLCQRDDAIRIVVTGLLSDPSTSDNTESKGKLVELAVILNEASQQHRRQSDDEEFDWNDMTWVPDPVDAGVNYKRPRNEDVIGTLIHALGSQEIFIKEFQLIIAERLLSRQAGFQQESKVLGLLKRRFGENALQNCDVMIKDIQDSKRVDAILRKTLQNNSHAKADTISYHSKILSRLFWPSLAKTPFVVPAPIAKVQSQYEAGFEELKSTRKLNWLDNLGTASVKLELEDRTVELECKTYEAAVIYAFQDDNQDAATSGSKPQQRTFNELWESLMMDEDLLEESLKFWVAKNVLRDTGSQTYVVLERLDHELNSSEPVGHDAPTADGTDSTQPSPKKDKSLNAAEKERRTIYWQFITGMLTNSAPAMPLGQIAMMMKMLIADGCPWSNEELQEFLGEKIAEGQLELSGGKYRLPKKGT
ncbi:Anaphase-promoting complex subunit [Paramyrothecium foliicola]|nr:Anaphase-promoting complex subunit [Paramyrothecium foliicola]